MAEKTKAKPKVKKTLKKTVRTVVKGKLSRNLKTGVNVTVIAGKDKGKTGKLVSYDRDRNKVIVEGVNVAVDYNHVGTQSQEEGQPLKAKRFKNLVIDISNVKLA